MLILFAIFKNPDSCLTSGTALRTKYYYSTQESSTENLPKAIAWGSGSIWFVQLCHRRFQQDTNIMWQSRTHRLVCLFHPPLFCFFFQSGQHVWLNESRRVEARPCWCFIQRVSWRTDAHADIHSQYQRPWVTDLITGQQEITGLLTLCRSCCWCFCRQ